MIWGNRKENGSIFSLQFRMFSTIKSYNEMTYIESSSVLFFLFSQNISFYSHIYKQHARLLSMYTVHPIVNFIFHRAATQILVMPPNLRHFLPPYYYIGSLLR